MYIVEIFCIKIFIHEWQNHQKIISIYMYNSIHLVLILNCSKNSHSTCFVTKSHKCYHQKQYKCYTLLWLYTIIHFFLIWFGRDIVIHRSIDADIRNVLQWHSHLNVWRRPQSNHVIKWWSLVDSISNRIIHWLNLCIGNALTTALRYSYQDFHYAKKCFEYRITA